MRLKNKAAGIFFLSIMLIGVSPVSAQNKTKDEKPAPDTVTKLERKTIESIISDYLLQNPSIIREALQNLQIQEENAKKEAVIKNILESKTELFADPDSPSLGSKNDNASIVVFYDYFCGYCRKSLPALQDLIAKDSTIRVIFKELPILGEQSLTASQASLAAHRQGKFTEFHQALLKIDSATDQDIKKISDGLGLNYETLKKDMKSSLINEAISRNLRLAELLQIDGTPAYLVGERIIPGAVDANFLAKVVAEERKKLKK